MKKLKNLKNNLKITLHPLFLILGVLMIFLHKSEVFFVCTISAFLHELGHSLVASKLGYKMDKIRLMPFGAELLGDTDSFDGKDEIYISLAGPLVNLLIVIITLGAWWIAPIIYDKTITILETNLTLFLFNLLPLFPLDGGRVLLCLLSKKISRRDGARVVKLITKICAITLFLGFLLTIFYSLNLTLGIMSFMLFFSASSSAKDAVYQKVSLSTLVQKRSVFWQVVSVPEHTKLYELKKLHTKNRVNIYIVLNKDGKEVFRFTELDLERANFRYSGSQEVGNLRKNIGI